MTKLLELINDEADLKDDNNLHLHCDNIHA